MATYEYKGPTGYAAGPTDEDGGTSQIYRNSEGTLFQVQPPRAAYRAGNEDDGFQDVAASPEYLMGAGGGAYTRDQVDSGATAKAPQTFENYKTQFTPQGGYYIDKDGESTYGESDLKRMYQRGVVDPFYKDYQGGRYDLSGLNGGGGFRNEFMSNLTSSPALKGFTQDEILQAIKSHPAYGHLGSGSNPAAMAAQVLGIMGADASHITPEMQAASGQRAQYNSPEASANRSNADSGFLGLGDLGQFALMAGGAALGAGAFGDLFGGAAAGAAEGVGAAGFDLYGGLNAGVGAGAEAWGGAGAAAGGGGLSGYNYMADAAGTGAEGTLDATVNTVADGVTGGAGAAVEGSPEWYNAMNQQGSVINTAANAAGGMTTGGSSVWGNILDSIKNIPTSIANNFEKNPLGTLNGAATIASSLFGKGGAFGDQGITGAQASSMADPFAASRPMYANQLNAMMANPSLSMATPGYQFARQAGQQGLDRVGAKAGQNFSGNQAIALNNYNQNYALGSYDNQVNRLAGLAGANANPAGGASAYLNAQQAQVAADQNMWKSLGQGIGGVQGLVGPVQNRASPTLNYSDQLAMLYNNQNRQAPSGYNPYGSSYDFSLNSNNP